jgi:hypothetical protein
MYSAWLRTGHNMYVTSSTAGRRGHLARLFRARKILPAKLSIAGRGEPCLQCRPREVLPSTGAPLNRARCTSFHRVILGPSTSTVVGSIESGPALKCALIVGC